MFDNDLESAIRLADEAIATGRKFGVAGIQAVGMSFKGVALVHSGEWRQGISLMDEAAIVATAEGSDLRAASDVYCNTIAVCRNLGDYRRAGEWTEKADRWMHAHSVGGYPGICQVHRAELKRLRGSWSEAEREARDACIELERFHILDGIGFAQYEIGEVRRRMGDFASAEEAFSRAYEYGHDGQPGFSLLMLDKGEVEEAAKSIAAALHRPEGGGSTKTDRLSRAHLLPAQVEIALANDDLETARAAVTELEEIARLFEGATWQATALTCRGSLELHDGEFEKAIDALDRAWRLWREVGLPYEGAQARFLLGQARRAQGSEGAAQMEFRAAASVFNRLGAAYDLRRLQDMAGDPVDVPRERVAKVFMFTDIVTSTDLVSLIGDHAWENLLHWHDRTLREAIGNHQGEVVRHTGDGFFATFDEAANAIDSAVSIQRTLAAHRREHGFAPQVRIGLHLAEATKEVGDYSGQGVHAAARVGAAAGAEEILVTSGLLEAAGSIPYQVSEARAVTLKGIAQPMPVQSVEWRLPAAT
jgi:class 3 adenylate cyclase